MNDRLYRSRSDRMLAGVAGGLAEHFDLDPSLVRVLWAILIDRLGRHLPAHLHRDGDRRARRAPRRAEWRLVARRIGRLVDQLAERQRCGPEHVRARRWAGQWAGSGSRAARRFRRNRRFAAQRHAT